MALTSSTFDQYTSQTTANSSSFAMFPVQMNSGWPGIDRALDSRFQNLQHRSSDCCYNVSCRSSDCCYNVSCTVLVSLLQLHIKVPVDFDTMVLKVPTTHIVPGQPVQLYWPAPQQVVASLLANCCSGMYLSIRVPIEDSKFNLCHFCGQFCCTVSTSSSSSSVTVQFSITIVVLLHQIYSVKRRIYTHPCSS